MKVNRWIGHLFYQLGLLSTVAHAFGPIWRFGYHPARRSRSTLKASEGEPTDHTYSTLPLDPLLKRLDTPNPGTDAARIFHGRGGLYPGCEHLTLDWFPPVWLLTSYNQELKDDEVALIQSRLTAGWQTQSNNDKEPLNLVYQFRSPTNATTKLLTGSIPDPHVITEAGMHFLVRLDRAKNHGLFLDMAVGRKWVHDHSKDGARVLNLFAYTCGFSVAALLGGAESVVNMDMVNGVLKQGQRNHELNDLEGTARFLAHDIFKSWGKIRKLGPYDLIVVDPPSFQKNSFVAKKDYGKIIRRLPDFLEEGGFVVLCLNAPELSTAWLKDLVQGETQELEFVERLDNPSSFPSKDEDRSLKVLIYSLKRASTDIG